MLLGIPLDELAWLVGSLLVAGTIAGFLSGIFGIGGGGIIVPVIFEALGALGFDDGSRMHVAIGTAVAITAPTTVRSFFAHKARGAVDMDFLKSWLIPVPVGVALASIVAAAATGAQLRAIFATITLFVGLRLIFNRETWRIGDHLPGGILQAVVGTAVGFFSTLMGIGGGVLTNTFMTLYGRPIHQGIATGAGVGVLITIPAVFGYMAAGWGAEDLPPFSIGYVNLLCFAIVMPLGLTVAKLGVGVAHRLSRRQLEIGFGIFLLSMSARFFLSI